MKIIGYRHHDYFHDGQCFPGVYIQCVYPITAEGKGEFAPKDREFVTINRLRKMGITDLDELIGMDMITAYDKSGRRVRIDIRKADK